MKFSGSKKSGATLSKHKRKFIKADISTPMDFKHISGVRWNSAAGFDVYAEDEKLKAFFKKAGVSEQQLEDKGIREFLYNFVDTHGGRDAVIRDITVDLISDTPPPAVPPRGPRLRNVPLPPLPQKSVGLAGRAKPSTEMMPAPTPTSSPIPEPVPSASLQPPSPPLLPHLVEPSQSTTVPSAPPAPPPIPVADASSPLPLSICDVTTLKPVEERKMAPQEVAHSDLLSEIRKGCNLQPMEEREVKPISNPPSKQGGIIDALQRELEKRSRAIQNSDDDDDDVDTADHEWED
ncbi:hypothetical protein NQ315_004781 [Exocentrus adspersus]|uniref:WH2 domain-containing protein n=1 Tax=Exocentrus adspersus TaxID=1586481 RepID=A0AAV8W1U8_9CUCU|nr:hypothetical protein NQ315_004781 [Exocentrus adspersus]